MHQYQKETTVGINILDLTSFFDSKRAIFWPFWVTLLCTHMNNFQKWAEFDVKSPKFYFILFNVSPLVPSIREARWACRMAEVLGAPGALLVHSVGSTGRSSSHFTCQIFKIQEFLEFKIFEKTKVLKFVISRIHKLYMKIINCSKFII